MSTSKVLSASARSRMAPGFRSVVVVGGAYQLPKDMPLRRAKRCFNPDLRIGVASAASKLIRAPKHPTHQLVLSH
jgi:hypothetical protein